MSNIKSFFSGKVFGGMLLIAGSCIGAGMLGLPIVMGLLGFFPSVILLLAFWVFMTFTGLLLVEINGWFKKQVNIVSMSEKAIGKFGKILSWTLYLFLFYSLLVAYIAVSGTIGSSILPFEFSNPLTKIVFALVLGSVVFFGTGPVDFFNRFLMFGKIGFYLAMLFFGFSKIDFSYLLNTNAKYFLLPIPILVISFGFHNIIPSLVAYMKGDLKKVKMAILGGSFLSLIVYLFWILMIIGIVPIDGENGLQASYLKGKEISSSLNNILGTSFITVFARGFSFCALITAFLAQSLALSHFLADGLKVEVSSKNNSWLVPLAIIPALVFALVYPAIFFTALNFAGGFCAIILFGILPAVMAWKGRYAKNYSTSYIVTGGKFSLIIAIIFSLIVLLNETISLF
ncbi:MAG: tyrosine transporter [Chlamydiae bacterium]|nr:tyrosine transporter [Chlamydiota bacterium]